ncbi:unnamed protein product [Linum tenue]|uniref:ASCH domain-containing protein n=1 Tax=Linum tenue TaxID=586396 RepID=A0AAV0IUH3_9ROSI|nr:unnamed protein product [Linum tenue]
MAQPSSPGKLSVDLKDAIDELLKFTIQSHINGNSGLDLGLSIDFCSALLDDDDGTSAAVSGTATSRGNRPPQPLYKLLASALYGDIISGDFSGVSRGEDSKRNGEWSAQIMAAATELANIFSSIEYDLHVQEPFFTQLRDGLKTVEGRCARGFYNQIQPGALILFNKCLVVRVQGVQRYTSFSEMLEAEGLDKVLPGLESIDEGAKVYRRFYTEDEERSNGVIGVRISRTAIQPCNYLAEIISPNESGS